MKTIIIKIRNHVLRLYTLQTLESGYSIMIEMYKKLDQKKCHTNKSHKRGEEKKRIPMIVVAGKKNRLNKSIRRLKLM
ncbi:unnamed protein product [Trifolium pratense]|uniref:Uncharacterized protein n=1 Tax=Trifolium pratense TaxID=57577 RepID=A0ACB0KVE3_TRIPR|nr:unnamed protein product [Trifolium pratense]